MSVEPQRRFFMSVYKHVGFATASMFPIVAAWDPFRETPQCQLMLPTLFPELQIQWHERIRQERIHGWFYIGEVPHMGQTYHCLVNNRYGHNADASAIAGRTASAVELFRDVRPAHFCYLDEQHYTYEEFEDFCKSLGYKDVMHTYVENMRPVAISDNPDVIAHLKMRFG